MSRPRADGYGDLLLYDLRRNTSGEEDERFVLHRYPNASVLVAGRNFGSGSSREAAVYALIDAGIKIVMATSFGDIFTSNAVNNGLLPARVSDTDHVQLLSHINGSEARVHVDLTTRCIRLGNLVLPFLIDDALRIKLINGWDDIDLTMNHVDQITAFRDKRLHEQPWSRPVTN